MKKEILFRGRKIGSNEWVYGYYYYSVGYDAHFIKESTKDGHGFIEYDHEVYFETVSQWEGHYEKPKTKHAKKLFPGDIVEVTWDDIYKIGNKKNFIVGKSQVFNPSGVHTCNLKVKFISEPKPKKEIIEPTISNGPQKPQST